jgi:hypothetical protein
VVRSIASSWNPANIRRRVRRARQFPTNTCPSSRHVQMMAETMLTYGRCHMLQEEPEHCAVSMLVTVLQLYKARTEIGRLKKKLVARGRK